MNKAEEKRSGVDADIWMRIKAVAKSKGMSMVTLSTKMGKSPNYMNSMYYDSKKLPCSLIVDLGKALGVPAEFLLTGNASVFEDEAKLRLMIQFAVNTDSILSHEELQLIYTSIINLIKTHENSDVIMKLLKSQETYCFYGEGDDLDVDTNTLSSGMRIYISKEGKVIKPE